MRSNSKVVYRKDDSFELINPDVILWFDGHKVVKPLEYSGFHIVGIIIVLLFSRNGL